MKVLEPRVECCTVQIYFVQKLELLHHFEEALNEHPLQIPGCMIVLRPKVECCTIQNHWIRKLQLHHHFAEVLCGCRPQIPFWLRLKFKTRELFQPILLYSFLQSLMSPSDLVEETQVFPVEVNRNCWDSANSQLLGIPWNNHHWSYCILMPGWSKVAGWTSCFLDELTRSFFEWRCISYLSSLQCVYFENKKLHSKTDKCV